MTQTTEDIVAKLLQPRYEVIADFWDNPFKVGDIIPFNWFGAIPNQMIEEPVKTWNTDFIESESGSTTYSELMFSPYPHLFKKLAWYEKRKVEEMPEYVKAYDKVYRIKDANEVYEWGFIIDHPHTEEHVSYDKCLPATHDDYINYLNKQK